MRKRREEEEKAKNEASHLEKQVWERHTFRSKNMLVAKVPTESIPMQKLTDRQYRLVEAKQRENEQKAKALLNGDELAPMKRVQNSKPLKIICGNFKLFFELFLLIFVVRILVAAK